MDPQILSKDLNINLMDFRERTAHSYETIMDQFYGG